MARRTSKSRRRRSRDLKLINVIEAYAYADILTRGAAGTSPYGFITGASDIATTQTKMFSDLGTYTGTAMVTTGTDQLSLSELVTSPDIAFGAMSSNIMSNWQQMVISSLGVSIGFKLGKKLLRMPINNVNRNIFKPLGIGVKL